MSFEYNIEEQDYLDFQLYTATKKERFYKRQTSGKYFLTFCSLVICVYFFMIKDWEMLGFFGLLAVVFFFFYPNYFRWRQKVHYTKFIRRHYKNLFGLSETLTIKEKQLHLRNTSGEGDIKTNEVNEVVETLNHFFIQLKSGASLIIPKRELKEANVLLYQLGKLKIQIVKDLNWKW